MREKINQNFLYKKNLLQQIRGFCYVARIGSVSQAAKALNLTQSTVTLQIQSLERDLGLKLFKRNSKPISLTNEGEEFYKMSCSLMHEFESVVEKFLDKRKQEKQSKIDIAVHHVAISYLMPQVIATLRKNNPEINVTIRNIAPSDALKRLKEGQIDLAFYPNLPADPEIYQTEIAAYDPILIMNKNHHMSRKSLQKLSDLKNYNLIRIDRSLITLPLFEEVSKVYEVAGSVSFENGNWEMLKSFVKKNDFAAVVSRVCIGENDKDLVIKDLSKFFPQMTYSVAVRSGRFIAPVTQKFINAIHETNPLFK